jgi:hypothetical protein
LLPRGNPARDTRGLKCWKSHHFGHPVSFATVSLLRTLFNVPG